ncbi:hypothetical protein TERTU_4493 [Teredinibacter turnerae T7901]|uniref:Uncharacterized protein n=1 Tax=Teredinibacter turnerae (strain ATCC 39867 / T7901) TaxID=377629 RepID=C5BJ78_TERTT|nr:hypothetical protein TERTU_4493 [Teredinibacter turnerae T7901]
MHKIKRSSVGLVAVIVITAYATNPKYCGQKTLRHIKKQPPSLNVRQERRAKLPIIFKAQTNAKRTTGTN